MTLTPKQAVALLPTGETIGEATRVDLRAEFARAYIEHGESEKLGPAIATAEDRIGAWLCHDREFKEAVVLLKAYLRQRGYKIGGSSEARRWVILPSRAVMPTRYSKG